MTRRYVALLCVIVALSTARAQQFQNDIVHLLPNIYRPFHPYTITPHYLFGPGAPSFLRHGGLPYDPWGIRSYPGHHPFDFKFIQRPWYI